MIALMTTTSNSAFPKNFVWGVATSAFQIEGASEADGKGPSIWDDFCRIPGAIQDASDGRVACDHYHRWAADLDLIAGLGVDAYRFSVSWPRVQPLGSGAFNEKGFEFYERLVDGMLARGLKPYLTLNHWDLPSALQATGGWENRDTVQRFVDYACEVARRLGDRVVSICTHNEPWVVAVLGNQIGNFAPGIKSRAVSLQVAHHLLLSHGRALTALRDQGCKSELGIVLNLAPTHAATDSEADQAKARLDDGTGLRWYLDPLLKGEYPADVLAHLGADAPKVLPGDLALIKVPLDFLGINYYMRSVSSAGEPWDVKSSGREITDMGWEVYPQGLTELLLRLHHDYTMPPIYITENGAAFQDEVVDGRVHDLRRQTYIANHIEAVAEAMRQGVRVNGYFVWSLLDNFEWASGYAKRFGIVRVDYDTQERTLKDSALWYRAFLSEQKRKGM
ncbi:beta-glucosidase. Glycosyl Hydrolase family 1 [Rhodoferax ferrireducens T118]|uniref:Beta-glucosidase n=2 Tax=Rhodoferax ferrireducens TaxID=192843 RepID=Q21ZG0_ALBFT|nr:beta-glucosidase. Glycosyl Hydrolase family 1 [Rhodoferax ferrireducens T118]